MDTTTNMAAPAGINAGAKAANSHQESQMRASAYAKTASNAASSVFSRALEGVFTAAIIFSITLTPFVLLQALAGGFMTMVITTPLNFLLVPYVFIMAGIGLKISSLFGCSAWYRITGKHWRE